MHTCVHTCIFPYNQRRNNDPHTSFRFPERAGDIIHTPFSFLFCTEYLWEDGGGGNFLLRRQHPQLESGVMNTFPGCQNKEKEKEKKNIALLYGKMAHM